MRVAALAIAPVKGMRLVAQDELELVASGPVGDRAFVVIDSHGALVQTRRTPELLQVVPRWRPGGRLELRFPDGAAVAEVPEPAGPPAEIELYGGRRVRARPVDGPLADALSEHLGRPVRLATLEPGQTGSDDHPVTLMSSASLDALADPLGAAPAARRFRMTITVEGAEAWAEDGWAEVGVGAALLRVVAPVPRCVVTTRDPDGGAADLPTLRALARLRGPRAVTFGVWCAVAEPGIVRVGDPVRIRVPVQGGAPMS